LGPDQYFSQLMTESYSILQDVIPALG